MAQRAAPDMIGLRAALIVFAVCTLLVGLIHAQPRDDVELRHFLTEGCENASGRPCWYGLIPGVTTYEEALARLHAHPWVDIPSLDITQISSIAWRWNAGAPSFLPVQTGSFANVVHFSTELIARNQFRRTVYRVTMPTTVALGNFWLSYGIPASFAVVTDMTDQGLLTAYIGSYPRIEGEYKVTVQRACPFDAFAFLSQAAILGWQTTPDPRAYDTNYDPNQVWRYLYPLPCYG